MSAEQTDVKWWFGWRVKGSPGGRPGAWVPQGPYDTPEQAKAAREASRAWDADVGVPFAASKADAQERCDTGQIY